MIVLLDTDVILDVALDRQPFAAKSAEIIDLAEKGAVTAFMAWHSVANIYYLVSSRSGDRKTRQFIKELLQFVDIAETDRKDAIWAVDAPLADFEDALQVAAAVSCSAQYILTRNTGHYRKSIIPVLTPKQYLDKKDPHSGKTKNPE